MSARALDPYGRRPTPNQPVTQTNRLGILLPTRNSIFELDGTGTLSGTVKEGAIPVAARKVFLLDKRNLSVLRCTVSAGDGAYSFAGLNKSLKYVVIAFDHTQNFNAVIADSVTPV
jgi:hypothetical protein